MMKGKIVYIGSDVPDKSPAGVRVFANALAMKEYGYEINIISVDKTISEDHTYHEGIETWHLSRPMSTKGWINHLVNVDSFTNILDKVEKISAIILYEIPTVAFIRLLAYCRKNDIKLVCECAEWQKWENLGHLNFLARLVRVVDIKLSMCYAYKKSDGLIVTSHFFDDHFKKCAPTLVLPTLQSSRIEWTGNNQNNKIRKFIYAGQLGYRKDLLNDIIFAFSKLKSYNFEFNILGLTKEDYLERFPEETKNLSTINKDTKKIKFWGKVSHTEVLEEVSKSDFALIIRESNRRNNVGFPTKFGESITCGTPVIVSDFSDVVYYTKKYNVGIVTNINHIEDGIIEALSLDNDSLFNMKQNCRSCDAFYYKGNIDNIGNFIDKILNK